MSLTPSLGSPVTRTRLRTPGHLADASGMCSACTSECAGPCEIGLSAIRGAEAMLPFAADINQFASAKLYPLDFSHFSVNGRVFGAQGRAEDPCEATFPNVDLATSFGLEKRVPIRAPLILPAMAKLAWADYFAGAALAGVPAVIGEDVVAKDQRLVVDGTRVVSSPLIAEMVQAYRRYQQGFGDIVLQANYDDEFHGVLELAIAKLGVTSVELKLGQAAKGIQGMGKVPRIEDALRFRELGYIVHPDPSDEAVAELHSRGLGPVFEKVGKLPMWNEESLARRLVALRDLGAERVCLKMGPFAPRDLVAILDIASQSGVDLVTFDGAGGGTGHSPVRMMNEWGIPTVPLECIVWRIMDGLAREGRRLPQIAMAGGFVLEDHIFKGLALGAPYVGLIALGRAAMAAAMVGRNVGEAIRAGSVPNEFARFGSSVEEVFSDLRLLEAEYGDEAKRIPTGAVGVYSYLDRVAVGLRQMMALNRKFALAHIGREDIVPLTEHAARSSGLPSYEELATEALRSRCPRLRADETR